MVMAMGNGNGMSEQSFHGATAMAVVLYHTCLLTEDREKIDLKHVCRRRESVPALRVELRRVGRMVVLCLGIL